MSDGLVVGLLITAMVVAGLVLIVALGILIGRTIALRDTPPTDADQEEQL